jgi:glycerol-3-phosphate O-acyltransferase
MPPKLGILSYVHNAYQTAGCDVAFVPVAINYDRVLEDSVLIEAAAIGKRQFRADIPAILRFTLRKIWSVLRGRPIRFGQAGVAFGAPVMLSSYPDTGALEDIAHDLMVRIAEQMPVLPVPGLAAILVDNGPMTEADLIAAFDKRFANRGLAQPGEVAVPAGLANLHRRNLVVPQGDKWAPDPEKQVILTYYANSVVKISAPAKS